MLARAIAADADVPCLLVLITQTVVASVTVVAVAPAVHAGMTQCAQRVVRDVAEQASQDVVQCHRRSSNVAM